MGASLQQQNKTVKKKCKIPLCSENRRALGFCINHYGRFKRGGDMNAPIRDLSRGLKKHPEYSSWLALRTRCNNPNFHSYPYYGGKGIKVCKRWDSFELFIKDMGPRPSSLHTVDRIKANRNYTPKNCRWATRKEQSQSRGYCKFNLEKARKVREMFKTGKYRYSDLAKIFKVGNTTIGYIVTGRTWKE